MSLRKIGLWFIVIVFLVGVVGGSAAETNFGHLLGTGWQGTATVWHSFWTTVNNK